MISSGDEAQTNSPGAECAHLRPSGNLAFPRAVPLFGQRAGRDRLYRSATYSGEVQCPSREAGDFAVKGISAELISGCAGLVGASRRRHGAPPCWVDRRIPWD